MPSIIQADQLKSADGNTTYLNSGTLSNLTFPAGHVIETKQTLYRDTVAVVYNDNYLQPSGFELTTTAKVANVKFLINYAVSLGMTHNADYNFSSGIFKDSDSDPLPETINSGIGTGRTKSSMHSWGYWNVSASGQYLMLLNGGQYLYTSSLAKDASITFKIKIRQGDTSNETIYVNRSGADTNESWISRSVSQITVQQIMP